MTLPQLVRLPAVVLVASGALLVAAACDNEPPPIPDSGPRRDTGARDTASADTMRSDTTPPTDTGAPDAGELSCVFDPADVRDLVSDPDAHAREVGLASAADGWAVVWRDVATTQSDVRGARLPSDGDLSAPAIVSVTDDAHLELDPVIVRRTDGYALAFTSNSAASFEMTSLADERRPRRAERSRSHHHPDRPRGQPRAHRDGRRLPRRVRARRHDRGDSRAHRPAARRPISRRAGASRSSATGRR